MACNPATGVTIMANGFGFFKSTDAAQTWAALSTPPSSGGNQSSIAFGGGQFVAFDNGTLYISGDDGVTWTNPSVPPAFAVNVATLMAFSPTLGTGSGMWMLEQNAGYSTSVDGGNTWSTFVGVPGMSSGAAKTNNLFWDGSVFAFSGRDAANSNSVIATTANGHTWSVSTFASIFGPDEIETMWSDGGSYVVGMTGSHHVRRAQSLAGLFTAPNTDLSLFLTGNNPVTCVFTPDGWLAVASIADNGTSTNVLAEQDTPTGPWVLSPAPVGMAANQHCIYWVYDAFHSVLIGSISGFSSGIITAPYTVHPAPVPDVVGDKQADAITAIMAAGFTVGPIASSYSGSYAAGLVISQFPTFGSSLPLGQPIDIVVSLGPQQLPVPNVVGLPLAIAEIVLAQNGFTVGKFAFSVEHSKIVSGSVSVQNPLPGTLEFEGSPVDLTIEVEALPFDPLQTVISQYQNSPTLLQLVENMSTYIDPTANLLAFYNNVWNVDTAQGFGLDIWGRIVGVSRVIPIPGTQGTFGFANTDSPPDWQNFGNPDISSSGGPFFGGATNTGSYRLNDNAFRTLILTKALANIVATTAPALNRLVQNLFPGSGRAYTRDGGQSNTAVNGMQMTYVFEFPLTQIQYAILVNSGALPHPAGVLVNIQVSPAGDTFGFADAGLEPFGQGAFNG
jgi:hypothetical protein